MKYIITEWFDSRIYDKLQRQDEARNVVLDKVNLVAALIVSSVLVVNLITGLTIPATGDAFILLGICLPVYFLNRFRKYATARFWFTLGTLAIIDLVSYSNILDGRHANTQVIMIGLSIIAVILYTGWTRRIIFSAFVASVIMIEWFRFEHHQFNFSPDFYLVAINYLISFACVYFFTAFFRNEISRYALEAIDLNQKLSQNEKKLRDSKMMLDSMIDNSPIYLAMVDADGKYVVVNQKYEKGFGIPKEEIIGKHYSEVLPKSFIEFHEPLVNRCLQGEHVDFYQDVTLPNGEVSCSYGEYFPIYDKMGKKVVYITVFVTDITGQKEAEAKLRELNQTKDKLFSIIAHDLSGPINTLKNVLYLREKDEITESELRGFTKRLGANVNILAHTLDNLLNWARSQFYGYHQPDSLLEPDPLISEIVKLFHEEIAKKNLKLSVKIEEGLKVCVDENDLRVIVRNLINNAIKFSMPGGEIEISVATEGEMASLSIRDHGVGMTRERVKAIQDKQLLTSEEGTSGERGTGIGLTLCWELAANNHWQLDLSSEENKGTVFILKLPITDPGHPSK